MMIAIFLLILGHAHATAIKCDVELTEGGVLPVVRLASGIEDPFEIDAMIGEFEWEHLLGREIRVRQQRTKKTVVVTKQRFLSRAMLFAEFPDLEAQVIDVDLVHDERRAKYDRNWLVNLLRSLRLFRKTVRLGDRFYPGELGSMSLRTPRGLWTSRLVAGFDQFRSLRPRLFMVHVSPVFDATKTEIIAYVDTLAGGVRPKLHVYFVHTHPGARPIPLSRQDIKSQRKIAELLDLWRDDFDYDLTMVALANLKSPRDVAFVRTIGTANRSQVEPAPGTEARSRSPRLRPRLNPPRRRAN